MFRLIPAIAVMVLALIIPAPAVAGDVEADVIYAAYENASLFTPNDDLDYAGIDTFVVDALDIWMDTASGSHCETYAAAIYGVAFLAKAFALDVQENDLPSVTMPLPAVMTLIEDQIVVLDRNCRNEL